MTEHVIWQNETIDVKDWQDFLQECYPDVHDEDAQYNLCCEENDTYLETERENLDIELPDEIIAIADIGRWDGVKHGYRECNTRNIKDLLHLDRDCVYGCFYVDAHHNMRSRQTHHDGTNHLLYRTWKPEISEIRRARFLDKLYYGKATKRDISTYTRRIGDPICAVYGW